MKKIIKILIVLVILIGIVSPLPVTAINTYESQISSVSVSNTYEAKLLSNIINDIKNAMLSGKDKVDLSKYKMNDNSTSIKGALNYYVPYFVEEIRGVVYGDSSGYVYIKIENPYSLTDTKALIEMVDLELTKIKSLLSTSYSDEKNALILHDYMVREYEYDIESYSTGQYPWSTLSTGGMLLHKKGICQTYAFLYKYILDSIGVETYYITSPTINHAWNIVNIDGKYYHTDLTWDDPANDRLGLVNHNNFLLSDTGITKTGHNGWDNLGIVCSDTKYDSYYWQNIISPIEVIGDDYYYAYNRQFVKANSKGHITKVIKDLGVWKYSNGGIWDGTYSGLLKNNNLLYFNDSNYVYTYNPDTGAINVVYVHNGSNYIYGIRERSSWLELNLGYSDSDQNHLLVPVNLTDYCTSITTNLSQIVVEVGESASITAKPFPTYVDYNFSYIIADTSIASVSSTGKITGKAIGKTTLIIKDVNGAVKTIPVRVCMTLPFNDVPKYEWYRETVEEVYSLGLMNGANDVQFKPTSKMNRAMVAIVFHRMEGSEKTNYKKLFSDVDNGEYYSESVTWAKLNGVINGYGNGTFRPLRQVTREEMAQMLYNFAKYKGVDVSANVDLSTFLDGNSVSSWHKDAMMWANANGLITGKYNGTKLDPQGTATRAECSKMLVQAYKIIYK